MPAGYPMPVPPAMPVAATTPKMMTITVANTCKRAAHLFEVTPDGKHLFVEAVNYGESCDVSLKSGSRYLAIIAHEQGGKPTLHAYTVDKEGIWLLRPEKGKATMPSTTPIPAGTTVPPPAVSLPPLPNSWDHSIPRSR
jgi:hypothetical protein